MRMKGPDFLLIREIGAGLWNEMHHILAQLLAAEILNRVPVIYWGKGSLYAANDGSNAFEQFFMPVSDFSIQDLAKQEYSFFPGRWNSDNILMPNRDNGKTAIEDLAVSSADVCVADSFIEPESLILKIPEGHRFYGLNRRELFNRLISKYIRLKEDAERAIYDFYNRNMSSSLFLAVHIRSSDKANEVRHLHELNERYPAEIEKVLASNPGIRIFLMTDCIDILEEYKKRYGDLLIHTDCRRVPGNGPGVHFHDFHDNRQKGLEIILDTWLAAKCDYFIGNGHSNVSLSVTELKNWEKNRITLLY